MCTPHQECCPYNHLNAAKYQAKCSHEGCTIYVHKLCHREWLTKHRYDFRYDLPILCRNHDANYLRWVRYRAGEIPGSENGTVPFQPFQLTDRVPRK